MRRAGPPQPAAHSPAPSAAGCAGPRTPAAGAEPRPATPPPPPPSQQSLLNEPSAPHPTRRPNFDSGPQNAGDAIRQAERNAAQNPGGGTSGDYGQNAPSQHPAMGAGADILSDTMGVDFGPYMKRVIAATYRSWIPYHPDLPAAALDKQGRVGVRFKILPDGSVKEMTLEFPSGDVSLDRAGLGIAGAAPPAPSPKTSKAFLELRFGSYYNLDPDKFH